MQQPINHRAHRSDIAQQFAPVLHRTVGFSSVLKRL
jgi:hypothetical protein